MNVEQIISKRMEKYLTKVHLSGYTILRSMLRLMAHDYLNGHFINSSKYSISNMSTILGISRRNVTKAIEYLIEIETAIPSQLTAKELLFLLWDKIEGDLNG